VKYDNEFNARKTYFEIKHEATIQAKLAIDHENQIMIINYRGIVPFDQSFIHVTYCWFIQMAGTRDLLQHRVQASGVLGADVVQHSIGGELDKVGTMLGRLAIQLCTCQSFAR
jgi:hypothetical protein